MERASAGEAYTRGRVWPDFLAPPPVSTMANQRSAARGKAGKAGEGTLLGTGGGARHSGVPGCADPDWELEKVLSEVRSGPSLARQGEGGRSESDVHF